MTALSSQGVAVSFDIAVYRLNAIKKAAYRFGDRCYVHIETPTAQQITVRLQPKQVLTNTDALVGEFRNEVLDQELREVVAQETEGVRNLLLAQAFSATNLLDPVGEATDFRHDPAGIDQPDTPHARTTE